MPNSLLNSGTHYSGNALRRRIALVGTVALLLVGCATPPPNASPSATSSPANAPVAAAAPMQPEAATGFTKKTGVLTPHYSVAAANPLATNAGYQILKAGGSAADAAIAMQMVLTLVEPQSSGIGGGAFLLHFDGKTTQAFDGRETAPAAATDKLFMGAGGKPMPFTEAVVGGRAVGVPGVLRMLALLHQQHGTLPWNQLFYPAIRLAKEGFKVSPRMATLLAADPYLKQDPVAADYFFDASGKPWPAGYVLRNPELAAVLQRIASEGPDAFMTGDVAHAMVNKVRKHPTNPGTMALQDLKNYKPATRQPLCFDYAVASPTREYRICGMPPPSSGTIAIAQILGMLNQTNAGSLPLTGDVPSTQWLHLYTEASRLAFADRAQFVADPDFVSAPGGDWSTLLATSYLTTRAKLIDAHGPSMKTAEPGNPTTKRVSFAPMPQQPEYGTSHISVVDARGNAVAMTTSIEDAWGSRQLVNRGMGLSGGFLLNNQLTDFSFKPTGADGKPVANRVQPGKRPRSSMSPVLVFDKPTGQLVMTAGSPGGPLIIHFTAKTLYGVLNWGLTPQQAIDLPNFGSLNGPTLLEDRRFDAAIVQTLKNRGHVVSEIAMPSGLQAIQITPAGLLGGADPRREGVVLGD